MTSTKIRYSLSLLICLLLGGALTAQVKISDLQEDSRMYKEWGILAGGNFQQIVAFPFVKTYNPGALAGAYIGSRNKMFSYRASLAVSSAQYETEFPLAHSYQLYHTYADKTSKGIFDVLYVNVPVVAELRPVNWLGLRMGAVLSYMPYINDNNGAYSKTADTKKLFKSSNISGTAGISIKISPKLNLDANYNIGFSDVNNQTFQGLTDKWLLSSGNVALVYQIKKWYPARQWQFNRRSH